jgi:hypothetical protein
MTSHSGTVEDERLVLVPREITPEALASVAPKVQVAGERDYAVALAALSFLPPSTHPDVGDVLAELARDYRAMVAEIAAAPSVEAGELVPVAWQWSDFSGLWYTVDTNTARLTPGQQQAVARRGAKEHEGRVRALVPASSLTSLQARVEELERHIESMENSTEWYALSTRLQEAEKALEADADWHTEQARQLDFAAHSALHGRDNQPPHGGQEMADRLKSAADAHRHSALRARSTLKGEAVVIVGVDGSVRYPDGTPVKMEQP